MRSVAAPDILFANLSTLELRQHHERLTVQIRSLQADSARCLAEIDRRHQAEEEHSPFETTPACWLSQTLNVSDGHAYSLIHTARQLDHLPLAQQALRSGEIGLDHAAVICRAMEEATRTSIDQPFAERDLVEAARHMNTLDLRRHWNQLRYQADQEAGLEAEADQRERRWARFCRTRWDTGQFQGELDGEGYSWLRKAIDAARARQKTPGDERTPDQRNADALVEICQRALAAGELPEQAGQRPQVTVVATLETLRLEPGSPLATLDWGAQVTGHTARRMAEDADITPVLVNRAGEVLHVGRRKRMLTLRQRKALNLRDQRCQHPGCDRPANQCQAHHERHWFDGGSTDLDNTRLYCRVHHSLLHPENARFRRPRAPD
jgi:Domain of unknown function (DUF222)